MESPLLQPEVMLPIKNKWFSQDKAFIDGLCQITIQKKKKNSVKLVQSSWSLIIVGRNQYSFYMILLVS